MTHRLPCWEARALAAFVYLTLAVAGCTNESRPAVSVSDSAGVRITLTADAERAFAEVDPQPVLSLGGPDAEGATQFSRIDAVHVDPHGNLWVADGGSQEVRLFHADGTFWKTRGGAGEGPGEFRRLRLLGAMRGDSVAVWDARLARLTLFDANGELARIQQASSNDQPIPRAHGVFADGTILAQAPRVLAAASLERGQLLGDTARLVRVDLTQNRATQLAMAPGPIWLWTGRSQIPIPFTINPGVAPDGESIGIVAGPYFRVRVFHDGQLRESFGVSRDAREVSPADVAAYTHLMEEQLPAPQRREYLSVLDHEARPRRLPAYDRLVRADGGNTWAEIYSPDAFGPRTWDVFDAGRAWLGQVHAPAGFTLSRVAGSLLVGVWRDELGVEYVRVYQLRQPGETAR